MRPEYPNGPQAADYLTVRVPGTLAGDTVQECTGPSGWPARTKATALRPTPGSSGTSRTLREQTIRGG